MNDLVWDIKTQLLHIREDIICGFHSGFPACCIKFWVTNWVWDINTKANRRHWRNIRRVRNYHIHYIPCPKCLRERNIVKVKKCPANCPKRKLVKEYIKALRESEKKNATLRKKTSGKQTRRNSRQRKRS